MILKVSLSCDGIERSVPRFDRRGGLGCVGGRVDSIDADTRFPPIAGGLLPTYNSDPPRDLRDRVAYCSGSGGLAALSGRQGLSMDLGVPVLSLSTGEFACDGVVSDSVGKGGISDWRIEERRVKVGDRGPACCGEVRGRALERRCDDTRTGYGDSWSKTMELTVELSRINRWDGDFDDKGVSWGRTGAGYRSASGARLATDSRDALNEVGVGGRCTDGPGRLGGS